MVADPLFLAYLAQYDDAAWLRVVDRLEGAIHPVDRAATRAWFHFFPLALQRALASSSDPAALAQHLRLQGRWQLADQRESSHWFLFGHRVWAHVRAAVVARAGTSDAHGSLDLAAQIQAIAHEVASQKRVDASTLVGIAAVALRTLQQVGLPVASAEPTGPGQSIGGPDADPDRLVSSRRQSSRGWLGFLKSGPRQFEVTFDERPPRRSFALIASQHVTTAAALDTRDYRAEDPRRTEGPIPVPLVFVRHVLGGRPRRGRAPLPGGRARAEHHCRARVPAERRAATSHPPLVHGTGQRASHARDPAVEWTSRGQARARFELIE